MAKSVMNLYFTEFNCMEFVINKGWIELVYDLILKFFNDTNKASDKYTIKDVN